ncbi:hypothetical protein INS_19847 [Yersinia pestis INS]|nr:hypothetical protein INS_19847 [Yersinia pestis INS]
MKDPRLSDSRLLASYVPIEPQSL